MGFDWLPLKNYKRHYICLKCKKGFKRPSEKDIKYSESIDFSNLMDEYYASDRQQDIVDYINLSHEKIKVVCPNCKFGMLQMHYNFEVPPQRDHKSWKLLQKRLSSETVLKYDTYIRWHYLELKKFDGNSIEFKILKQNLTKLERIA